MFFVCSNGASECISLLWVEMNCVICPMITLNYEWFGPDVATNKIVREHNTMWIQFVRHRNICKKMWHNLWFYVVLLFSLAYSSMAWIAYYELPGLKWSFAYHEQFYVGITFPLPWLDILVLKSIFVCSLILLSDHPGKCWDSQYRQEIEYGGVYQPRGECVSLRCSRSTVDNETTYMIRYFGYELWAIILCIDTTIIESCNLYAIYMYSFKI